LATESQRSYAINKPVVAIVLSLIAGIFAFINGLFRLLYAFFGLSMTQFFGSFGELLRISSPFDQLMSSLGASVFAVADTLAGFIILIGALMLDSRPRKSRKWGAIILIFSIYGFLGGSLTGLHIVGVLGVIGGAIAILWKVELK
jgi:asparagine N-glycosylation enzyme membrane subunit Stt3